jgi:hypothetical protein
MDCSGTTLFHHQVCSAGRANSFRSAGRGDRCNSHIASADRKVGAGSPHNSRHQLLPRTPESSLNSTNRREQNVNVASFNLLHRASIELRLFSKPFLRNGSRCSFTANVGSKPGTEWIFASLGHAPLRRNCSLTNTAH